MQVIEFQGKLADEKLGNEACIQQSRGSAGR
jgi:hypothetical protein